MEIPWTSLDILYCNIHIYMIYMYTQIDRYSQLNMNIPSCSTNEVVGTLGFLRQRAQCQWRQGGLHLHVRYVLRLSRPVGPSRSQFSFLHILHRCLQIAFPITVINGLLHVITVITHLSKKRWGREKSKTLGSTLLSGAKGCMELAQADKSGEFERKSF